MSANSIYAIASVLLVSLISLVGLASISMSERRLQQLIFVSVSLAAGALFGDAFIHLLPESFGVGQGRIRVSLYVLAGIFLFFILEKFLRWRHAHLPATRKSIQPVGYLNLFADGAHNLLDGMLIGASYTVGLPIGIATTIAVILHEIPQEMGDFGVLLHAGFSRRGALFFNFLSASLSIAGALVSILASDRLTGFSQGMLPLTAGGFIYIAGSDLLPELHKELEPMRSLVQLTAMGAGVGLMLLLVLFE